MFKGDEKPAKEWECVLIYDEATQTFTLEKLDSLVNLNFDVKAQPRTRPPVASRTSPPSPFHTHAPPLSASPFPTCANDARVRAMLTNTAFYTRTYSSQCLVLLCRTDATTISGAYGC